MNYPADLIPGDIIPCAGIEIVRRATNSDCGHVAVYCGLINGVQSVVTSLTEFGVNIYALSVGAQNPVRIRRTKLPFNLEKALIGFKSIQGIEYGWGDCAGDVGLPAMAGGMNCSHTSSIFLEYGECPQFDPTFKKSFITPRDLNLSYQSETILEF